MPDVVHNQGLTKLSPTTTVRAAVEIMAKRRIGVVMVVEGGALQGIFSERDLVSRVIACRRDPDQTTLAEVMTPSPVTISPEASVTEALALMESNGIRHLPVTVEDRVVGMVSIRDLFAVIRRELESDLRERDEFIYGASFSPVEPESPRFAA